MRRILSVLLFNTLIAFSNTGNAITGATSCGPNSPIKCPGECVPVLSKIAPFPGWINHIVGPGENTGFFAGRLYNMNEYGLYGVPVPTPPHFPPQLLAYCTELGSPVEISLPPVTSQNSPQCPVNSSINMDSLALGESIPLVGVPFILNYSSDRMRQGVNFKTKTLGLGGWTPSTVHHYDITNKLLYFGDGGIRNIQAALTSGGYYATDAAGSEVYYFNSSGVHTQTKDSLTGVVKHNFSYDSLGRLISVTDQFGNVTSIQYSDLIAVVRSPYGQASIVAFDSNGFLASVSDPLLETYFVTNDSNGFLQNFTKPMGQKSTVTYSSELVVAKDQGAGGDFLSFTQNTDAKTGVQTVTSITALGRLTTYQTSSTGPTNSSHNITSPDGSINTYSNNDVGSNTSNDQYGDTGNYTTVNDPRFGMLAPFTASSTYSVPNSSINLTTSTTKAADLVNANDPFSFSTLITKTTLQNDNTRTFTSTYSSNDRSLKNVSAMGRVANINLNSFGNLSQIQVGTLTSTELQYDTHGRIFEVDQGVRTTKLSYDNFSNLASVQDPMGRVISFEYDLAGRKTKEILPNGEFINMSYDANGNLTSITPPHRPKHQFIYNIFDLLGSYIPPTVKNWIAGTQTTSYVYNLDKQVTEVDLPDGKIISYNYDAVSGKLNSISSPNGNYVLSYLPKSGALSSISSPDGENLSYQYVGSVANSITSSGPVSSAVNFSFNNDFSLNSVSITDGRGTTNSVAYSFDKDQMLSKAGDLGIFRDSNGEISKSRLGIINEEREFNNFGELVSDSFTGKNGTILYSANISRDNLGRIVEINQEKAGRDRDDGDDDQGKGNDNLKYEYDSVGRLILVKHGGEIIRRYSYDTNGNRIMKSGRGGKVVASYDDQDRLLTYGNTQYKYDNSGNLMTKSLKREDGERDDRDHNKDADKITKYNYDVFGNLKSVTLPSGKLIEYIVDGQNRRVGKKINGVMVQEFIYQSRTQIAAELDGSGKLIKQFIYGTKSNVPDYMVYKGKDYRIISDQVGTPKMLVDAASEKVVERYHFDEFGIQEDEDRDSTIPFGFAGGLFDTDTKLVRFGKRDYDPYVGRFISKDLIGFGGGSANLFSYVNSDPINFVDPKGEDQELVVDGIHFGIRVFDPTTGGGVVVDFGPVPAAGSSDWMQTIFVLLGQTVKGAVNISPYDPQQWSTVPNTRITTSAAVDNDFLNKVEASMANPPNYNLYTKKGSENCYSFLKNVGK